MSEISQSTIGSGAGVASQRQPVEGETVLTPLALLAALDDSEKAVLIFDSAQRLLHITNHARNLLKVLSPEPLHSPEVPNLLSRANLRPDSLELALKCLSELSRNPSMDAVLLHRQNGPDSLCMRLRSLTEDCCAAYFEAVEPEHSPVSGVSEFALRDALTGLASRRSLELALEKALTHSPSPEVAVLLIDLDRFKAVNDTMGHAAGDTLLRLVAERLQAVSRKGDIAARFGGDEFAILLDPCPDRTVPSLLAQRILDLVQRTYLIEGQLVNVGASVGIAISPHDGQDTVCLLRSADLALYHSKTSGRATFHFFDISMEQRALARRNSELELRRALALRQLEVYYQPQVTVDGQLEGFEALLRWQHPERGTIPPLQFLPLAEEIGMIVPIGDWVLRTACREATKWPSSAVLAVNASPLQIQNGLFADSVRRALKVSGLPGHRLEIEITEGTLLTCDEAVFTTLRDLRGMNVRIAMDDFGTGYASLSQLARFPFDKIKIDRSLAGFEGDDSKKRAIVRAITSLGQSLGICTLAEGVETAEQLLRLQLDGCASAQGYLFGRPVPASELQNVISRLAQAEKAPI